MRVEGEQRQPPTFVRPSLQEQEPATVGYQLNWPSLFFWRVAFAAPIGEGQPL